MLIDLTLYEYKPLVRSALGLLVRHFEQRRELHTAAEKVQLLIQVLRPPTAKLARAPPPRRSQARMMQVLTHTHPSAPTHLRLAHAAKDGRELRALRRDAPLDQPPLGRQDDGGGRAVRGDVAARRAHRLLLPVWRPLVECAILAPQRTAPRLSLTRTPPAASSSSSSHGRPPHAPSIFPFSLSSPQHEPREPLEGRPRPPPPARLQTTPGAPSSTTHSRPAAAALLFRVCSAARRHADSTPPTTMRR